MENLFPEEETKGRYCRLVREEDGSIVFKPVKVPEHVKRERAERIRRRELRQRVEQNRARAQTLNLRLVLFLALVLVVCCFVCYIYLSLRSEVASRLDVLAGLQADIEQAESENDLTEIHLDTGEQLTEIKRKAEKQLGMQRADSRQIVYYSVCPEDYMVQMRECPE